MPFHLRWKPNLMVILACISLFVHVVRVLVSHVWKFNKFHFFCGINVTYQKVKFNISKLQSADNTDKIL
jgi:hypothetical protein